MCCHVYLWFAWKQCIFAYLFILCFYQEQVSFPISVREPRNWANCRLNLLISASFQLRLLLEDLSVGQMACFSFQNRSLPHAFRGVNRQKRMGRGLLGGPTEFSPLCNWEFQEEDCSRGNSLFCPPTSHPVQWAWNRGENHLSKYPPL